MECNGLLSMWFHKTMEWYVFGQEKWCNTINRNPKYHAITEDGSKKELHPSNATIADSPLEWWPENFLDRGE